MLHVSVRRTAIGYEQQDGELLRSLSAALIGVESARAQTEINLNIRRREGARDLCLHPQIAGIAALARCANGEGGGGDQ